MARTVRIFFPRVILLLAVLLPASALAGKRPMPQAKAAPAAQAWKFAVSGDSRNCGNIAMPTIAADARKQGVAFYWHLGDLRWMSNIDEDILRRGNAPPPSLRQYQATAWQDAIDNQLKAWGDTPVFLGIGNHELYGGTSRAGFMAKFRPWTEQPAVKALRSHEGLGSAGARTYFHWIERGIDFIYLDNASQDQFDEAQMQWLGGVLARAAKNPEVRSLVVGAHAPLPNSFGKDHAMDNWPVGLSSGTRVYQMLLELKRTSGKAVTLISSHQHFYMPNAYNTEYWQANGGVLPGYIVGSAGAHRYALPADAPAGSKTMVYGYILGTADPSGATQFDYREVHESDVPQSVRARYIPEFIHWCFAENGDRK